MAATVPDDIVKTLHARLAELGGNIVEAAAADHEGAVVVYTGSGRKQVEH